MDINELGNWAVMVAIVMAMVEMVKRAFPQLEARWLPLFALVFGVGWTLATRYGGDVGLTISLGIGVGLAAMGLFSGGKAIVGK